jgi:hypothetical protein
MSSIRPVYGDLRKAAAYQIGMAPASREHYRELVMPGLVPGIHA